MSFKQYAIFPSNPATERGISTKLSASKDRIVYASGKTIVIRDLKNPKSSISYNGHIQNATIARISPSGYYCASGDAGGTVRVWDTVGEDHALKGEYKVISGRINDLEWDGESKRIIAVGDGKEKFGHAFMMDTGTSTGVISGHFKAVNAVSIRHQRPFRAATGGDDAGIIFHQGVPYKYDKSIKTHTKFVQDVRYAPSGDIFASVGSDFKIFLYDGKNGDTLDEVTDSPHKGSIMACTWSPDSKSLVTSSADCTVKLWDVETRKAITTWTVGNGVSFQQVGNTWSGESDVVSLSLSGDLNVFDIRTGDKPSRIIQGPQKPITAIAPVPALPDTFLAGTADGRVLSYSKTTGESSHMQGVNHSTLVTSLASSSAGGSAFSAGFDDCVREIGSDGTGFTPSSFSLSSQPKSLAVGDDASVFVAEIKNSIEVIRSNQKIFDLSTKYTPSAIAVKGSLVAIGGEDSKVHLYQWDGKSLEDDAVPILQGNKAVVSALAFSPDGNLLASGDSSGSISLFDIKEKKLITSRWSFHTARVNSLSWTSDSKHCASGSLDTHVYIWSVAKPLRNIAIKNAGARGVNAVLWIDNSNGKTGQLVSSGADASVKVWEVTFHAA
ncbi:WD40-repeat-containing domain protein [Lentinula edodes]|uniref:WD40-repeat-containing domain protein n=1 Tax=Lentinula edodes TaxID=5353 RepID=UPI001E8DD540|nr:WD40-repeat-containing domain protein [Lentinula edodes]KAH7878576.1 WD40-repeat-containing domain protein [Lentinula edodes]